MGFIDIHTHKKQLLKNIFSVVNQDPLSEDFSGPFSIGIHPWYLNENYRQELEIVAKKLQNNNCVALGECGVDKAISTDVQLQIAVFKEQVLLSERFKKPLIIHCVKAYQEILAIKKEMQPQQVWILHGFHKNFEISKQLRKHQLRLSFGAALLSNKKLQDVFERTPLDSIFLETDDSDHHIFEMYEKAASLKQISLLEIQETIRTNFKKVFKS